MRGVWLRLALVALLGGGSLATEVRAEATPACMHAGHAAVTETVLRWKAAAGAADIEALAGLYAADARLLTSDGKTIVGRQAIAEHLSGLLSRYPMGPFSEAVAMHGCEAASSSGHILLRVTGDRKGTRKLLSGDFSISLERRAGRWVITHHELRLSQQAARSLLPEADPVIIRVSQSPLR